jgi:hypothetical protein
MYYAIIKKTKNLVGEIVCGIPGVFAWLADNEPQV